jgi:hypothetical protein
MTTIITKKQEVLNLSTIIFNERLKEWITNIKDNSDLSLNPTWTMDECLDFQRDMRDRFIRTSYMGMLENGLALGKSNKDYPNIYALFLLLMSEIEPCNNWNDVTKHVIRYTQLVEYENLTHLTSLGAERLRTIGYTNTSSNISRYYCLCGHYVKSHLYKIRNTKTELVLWCGCDCIEKSKIVSNKEMKACKDKYERKRLEQIRQREYLDEQARLNKERLLAYQQKEKERLDAYERHQKATFTIIIKVFESQYALQKHKETLYKKRQLQQGRKVLFNIITKSKSHT